MSLLTKALAALLALAVLTGGALWLQLRACRADALGLQASAATARAEAALCSSATQELARQGDALKARVQAAEVAARKAARVQPLPNPPKAGDGCERAAAWAVEQAPALVRAWEGTE